MAFCLWVCFQYLALAVYALYCLNFAECSIMSLNMKRFQMNSICSTLLTCMTFGSVPLPEERVGGGAVSDFRTGVTAHALQSTNTATVTSDELLLFFSVESTLTYKYLM